MASSVNIELSIKPASKYEEVREESSSTHEVSMQSTNYKHNPTNRRDGNDLVGRRVLCLPRNFTVPTLSPTQVSSSLWSPAIKNAIEELGHDSSNIINESNIDSKIFWCRKHHSHQEDQKQLMEAIKLKMAKYEASQAGSEPTNSSRRNRAPATSRNAKNSPINQDNRNSYSVMRRMQLERKVFPASDHLDPLSGRVHDAESQVNKGTKPTEILCAICNEDANTNDGDKNQDKSDPKLDNRKRINELNSLPWRLGTIRAINGSDLRDENLALLIEFDLLDWQARDWYQVHKRDRDSDNDTDADKVRSGGDDSSDASAETGQKTTITNDHNDSGIVPPKSSSAFISGDVDGSRNELNNQTTEHRCSSTHINGDEMKGRHQTIPPGESVLLMRRGDTMSTSPTISSSTTPEVGAIDAGNVSSDLLFQDPNVTTTSRQNNQSNETLVIGGNNIVERLASDFSVLLIESSICCLDRHNSPIGSDKLWPALMFYPLVDEYELFERTKVKIRAVEYLDPMAYSGQRDCDLKEKLSEIKTEFKSQLETRLLKCNEQISRETSQTHKDLTFSHSNSMSSTPDCDCWSPRVEFVEESQIYICGDDETQASANSELKLIKSTSNEQWKTLSSFKKFLRLYQCAQSDKETRLRNDDDELNLDDEFKRNDLIDAIERFPKIYHLLKDWHLYQDAQILLGNIYTASLLVGNRVRVYRSSGTTQWYTAVISSYDERERQFILIDDTVLEEHHEDPTRLEMHLLDDRLIQSLIEGDGDTREGYNSGSTRQRRTQRTNQQQRSQAGSQIVQLSLGSTTSNGCSSLGANLKPNSCRGSTTLIAGGATGINLHIPTPLSPESSYSSAAAATTLCSNIVDSDVVVGGGLALDQSLPSLSMTSASGKLKIASSSMRQNNQPSKCNKDSNNIATFDCTNRLHNQQQSGSESLRSLKRQGHITDYNGTNGAICGGNFPSPFSITPTTLPNAALKSVCLSKGATIDGRNFLSHRLRLELSLTEDKLGGATKTNDNYVHGSNISDQSSARKTGGDFIASSSSSSSSSSSTSSSSLLLSSRLSGIANCINPTQTVSEPPTTDGYTTKVSIEGDQTASLNQDDEERVWVGLLKRRRRSSCSGGHNELAATSVEQEGSSIGPLPGNKSCGPTKRRPSATVDNTEQGKRVKKQQQREREPEQRNPGCNWPAAAATAASIVLPLEPAEDCSGSDGSNRNGSSCDPVSSLNKAGKVHLVEAATNSGSRGRCRGRSGSCTVEGREQGEGSSSGSRNSIKAEANGSGNVGLHSPSEADGNTGSSSEHCDHDNNNKQQQQQLKDVDDDDDHESSIEHHHSQSHTSEQRNASELATCEQNQHQNPNTLTQTETVKEIGTEKKPKRAQDKVRCWHRVAATEAGAEVRAEVEARAKAQEVGAEKEEKQTTTTTTASGNATATTTATTATTTTLQNTTTTKFKAEQEKLENNERPTSCRPNERTSEPHLLLASSSDIETFERETNSSQLASTKLANFGQRRGERNSSSSSSFWLVEEKNASESNNPNSIRYCNKNNSIRYCSKKQTFGQETEAEAQVETETEKKKKSEHLPSKSLVQLHSGRACERNDILDSKPSENYDNNNKKNNSSVGPKDKSSCSSSWREKQDCIQKEDNNSKRQEGDCDYYSTISSSASLSANANSEHYNKLSNITTHTQIQQSTRTVASSYYAKNCDNDIDDDDDVEDSSQRRYYRGADQFKHQQTLTLLNHHHQHQQQQLHQLADALAIDHNNDQQHHKSRVNSIIGNKTASDRPKQQSPLLLLSSSSPPSSASATLLQHSCCNHTTTTTTTSISGAAAPIVTLSTTSTTTKTTTSVTSRQQRNKSSCYSDSKAAAATTTNKEDVVAKNHPQLESPPQQHPLTATTTATSTRDHKSPASCSQLVPLNQQQQQPYQRQPKCSSLVTHSCFAPNNDIDTKINFNDNNIIISNRNNNSTVTTDNNKQIDSSGSIDIHNLQVSQLQHGSYSSQVLSATELVKSKQNQQQQQISSSTSTKSQSANNQPIKSKQARELKQENLLQNCSPKNSNLYIDCSTIMPSPTSSSSSSTSSLIYNSPSKQSQLSSSSATAASIYNFNNNNNNNISTFASLPVGNSTATSAPGLMPAPSPLTSFCGSTAMSNVDTLSNSNSSNNNNNNNSSSCASSNLLSKTTAHTASHSALAAAAALQSLNQSHLQRSQQLAHQINQQHQQLLQQQHHQQQQQQHNQSTTSPSNQQSSPLGLHANVNNMPKLGITSTTSSNHQNHNHHLALPPTTSSSSLSSSHHQISDSEFANKFQSQKQLLPHQHQTSLPPLPAHGLRPPTSWQDIQTSMPVSLHNSSSAGSPRWSYAGISGAGGLGINPSGPPANFSSPSNFSNIPGAHGQSLGLNNSGNSNQMIGLDSDKSAGNGLMRTMNNSKITDNNNSRQSSMNNQASNMSQNLLLDASKMGPNFGLLSGTMNKQNQYQLLDNLRAQNPSIDTTRLDLQRLPDGWDKQADQLTMFTYNLLGNTIPGTNRPKRVIPIDESRGLRESICNGEFYTKFQDLAVGLLSNIILISDFNILEYIRRGRHNMLELEKMDYIHKQLGISNLLHLSELAEQRSFLLQQQAAMNVASASKQGASISHNDAALRQMSSDMAANNFNNITGLHQQQHQALNRQQPLKSNNLHFLPPPPGKSDFSNSSQVDKGRRSSQSPSDNISRSHLNSVPPQQRLMNSHSSPSQYQNMNPNSASAINTSNSSIPPSQILHSVVPDQRTQQYSSVGSFQARSSPFNSPMAVQNPHVGHLSRPPRSGSAVGPFNISHDFPSNVSPTSLIRQPPAAHQNSARPNVAGSSPNLAHAQLSNMHRGPPVSAHMSSKTPLTPRTHGQENLPMPGKPGSNGSPVERQNKCFGSPTPNQISNAPFKTDSDPMAGLPVQALLSMKQQQELAMRRVGTPYMGPGSAFPNQNFDINRQYAMIDAPTGSRSPISTHLQSIYSQHGSITSGNLFKSPSSNSIPANFLSTDVDSHKGPGPNDINKFLDARGGLRAGLSGQTAPDVQLKHQANLTLNPYQQQIILPDKPIGSNGTPCLTSQPNPAHAGPYQIQQSLGSPRASNHQQQPPSLIIPSGPQHQHPSPKLYNQRSIITGSASNAPKANRTKTKTNLALDDTKQTSSALAMDADIRGVCSEPISANTNINGGGPLLMTADTISTDSGAHTAIPGSVSASASAKASAGVSVNNETNSIMHTLSIVKPEETYKTAIIADNSIDCLQTNNNIIINGNKTVIETSSFPTRNDNEILTAVGTNSDSFNTQKASLEPPSKYQKLYTKKAWLKNYDQEDKARTDDTVKQPQLDEDSLINIKKSTTEKTIKSENTGIVENNDKDIVEEKMVKMERGDKVKRKVMPKRKVKSGVKQEDQELQQVKPSRDLNSKKRSKRDRDDAIVKKELTSDDENSVKKAKRVKLNNNDLPDTSVSAHSPGEVFLQTQSCYEIVPKNIRCMECRRVRSSNLKSEKSNQSKNSAKSNWDDFCRFYEFRKLEYTKDSQLVVAGFSSIYDSDKIDEKLWLPNIEQAITNLNYKSACYILECIGDVFCSIVKQERGIKEAYDNHKRGAEDAIWRKAVNGMRELCDVCSTTLFNYHYFCERCGFVVCFACQQERKKQFEQQNSSDERNGTISKKDSSQCSLENSNDNKDNDDVQLDTKERQVTTKRSKKDALGWIFCAKNEEHTHDKLALAQIITGYCLDRLSIFMHRYREKTSLSECKTCKEDKIQEVESSPSPISTSSTSSSSSSTTDSMSLDPITKPIDKSDDDDTEDEVQAAINECLEKVDAEPLDQDKPPNDESAAEVEVNRFIPGRMEKPNFKFPPGPSGDTTAPSPTPAVEIDPISNKSIAYWLSDGELLVLKRPRNRLNFPIFRKQWKRRLPVIVRSVHKTMDRNRWLPKFFGKEYGDYRSDLVDCRNGDIHRHSMKKYWDGFEPVNSNPKKKSKESDSTNSVHVPATGVTISDDCSIGACYYTGSALWRLKDWPPGIDFKDVLPTHYEDFMKNLPLAAYTTRTGRLNLACRLPREMLKPDLGPKMYSAYGTIQFPERGTTNLHLDISDAINVMVYVGGARALESGSEELRDMFEKTIDDCYVEEDMKQQIRKEKLVPGALWHIFKPSDAHKMREFLDKIAEERGIGLDTRSDPIHDQTWYLDRVLLDRLKKEHGVKSYAILQCMGDAILIPAGAPHQVKNLHNCIKVANDFVSPENVRQCLKLTDEFRNLPETHINQEDKLQIKNILYHSVKETIQFIKLHEQEKVNYDLIPADSTDEDEDEMSSTSSDA